MLLLFWGFFCLSVLCLAEGANVFLLLCLVTCLVYTLLCEPSHTMIEAEMSQTTSAGVCLSSFRKKNHILSNAIQWHDATLPLSPHFHNIKRDIIVHQETNDMGSLQHFTSLIPKWILFIFHLFNAQHTKM